MRRSGLNRVLWAGVLVCAGCLGPNLEMKRRTDAVLAQHQVPLDRSFPTTALFEHKPWAVGQWALYRIVSKGEPAVQRLSIVGREGPTGFWVEDDTQTYNRRTVAKVLYRRQPHNPDEAIELAVRVVTLVPGGPPKVRDYYDPNNPLAASEKERLHSYLSSSVVAIDVDRTNRQTVTVVPGIFEGCYSFVGRLSAGPFTKDYSGWAHPAVPVLGVVKGASLDWELTTELIDFGETGATSAFDEPAHK